MHIVDPKPVLLRQPEDGQYRLKHEVVHLAIKYTYVTQSCLALTVVLLGNQGCFISVLDKYLQCGGVCSANNA